MHDPLCVCRSRGTVGSTCRRSSTGNGGRARSAAVSPPAAPPTPSRISAATPTSSPRAAASASAAPRWTPCWPQVARAPSTRGRPADGLTACGEELEHSDCTELFQTNSAYFLTARHKDVKIFMSYHRSFWVCSWEHRKPRVLRRATDPCVTTLYDSEGSMCWEWKPSNVSF